MDQISELLKTAPISAQLLFFAIVGVAVGLALMRRILDGVMDGRAKAKQRTEEPKMVANQTATLADMTPIREAVAELRENAALLRRLADGLPEFAHIAPMVRDTNAKIGEALDAMRRMEIAAARREGEETERRRHES